MHNNLRTSLFNTEVEGYTQRSNVKLTILALTLFATFVFITWAMSQIVYMVTVMDVWADVEIVEEPLLDELLKK